MGFVFEEEWDHAAIRDRVCVEAPKLKIPNCVFDKKIGSFFLLSVWVVVWVERCHCLFSCSKCSGLVISKNRNIDGTSSYRVDFLRLTRLIFYGGIFFRQPCRRVLETTKEKKVSNLCVLLKLSGALVQSLQFLAGTPYLDIYLFIRPSLYIHKTLPHQFITNLS